MNKLSHTLNALVVVVGVACTPVLAQSPAETQRHYLSGKGSDDAVEWDFFISEGRKSGAWTKIKVPSCWELEGFGTYQYGIPFYGKPNPPGLAREQGKYRHTFEIPADWNGKRVRIVFEGAMTDTHVRVNGISTGPAHQGGFYRFKHDISGLLKYGGSNQIEVTVDKESANESVNLAERRADYWNFGGIFRPVYLEVLPAHFIDRAALDARADGSFHADVFLGHAAESDARVTAQIVDAAGANVGAAFEGRPAPGADRVVLRTAVTAPKLWTAETPNLYGVRFTLHKGDAAVHTTTARFGFRTFEVRPGHGLFLNGQRILLKGVNRHSFWPDSGRTLNRERNYADVRLIKEMNMNAVRTAHYPPDVEFLEACDELGLYVLDELGGWHGKYDEATGRRLIGQMVARDVNHPSVLFWNNGNEGGWNAANDGEFAKWDPQGRLVLHPQQELNGVETMHYRSYGEVQEYLRGQDIYMPTEFLHGLYDGGHGAGLFDYWEMLRKHPRAGGGFLWVFADEGVKRTDMGGRIDTVGNYGADGIVGPHRQREGSFDAVREIWSPVQIGLRSPARERRDGSETTGANLPALTRRATEFDGTLVVENRYDFTNLAQCTFGWSLARFPTAESREVGHTTIASGDLNGPDIAPHASGELRLPLPADWREADVLYVTAKNPGGEAVWTWSWWVKPVETAAGASHTNLSGSAGGPQGNAKAEYRNDYLEIVVFAGALELRFEKSSGQLVTVRQNGKPISFGKGPRFIAARRGDRTLDGTIDRDAAKGIDRIYKAIEAPNALTSIEARADGADVVVEARYFGPLRTAVWRIGASGEVRLDYEYGYDGVVELMGVTFDYPESKVRAVRWLGSGPYRVWQNRTQGGVLDVWRVPYNDPIPGESFLYPEFKGYRRDWRWATFETNEGAITLTNGTPGSFLGVYTPRDGRDALLYTLPETAIGIFDVIPAVRNKVNATDLIGPASQPQRVEGVRRGSVRIKFETR